MKLLGTKKISGHLQKKFFMLEYRNKPYPKRGHEGSSIILPYISMRNKFIIFMTSSTLLICIGCGRALPWPDPPVFLSGLGASCTQGEVAGCKKTLQGKAICRETINPCPVVACEGSGKAACQGMAFVVSLVFVRPEPSMLGHLDITRVHQIRYGPSGDDPCKFTHFKGFNRSSHASAPRRG